jgi:NAD(P)-dependent dehydrogenase (short-subunit alcohol dehydrogenase family)
LFPEHGVVNLDLAGKTAVVTGASRGIGAAIAQEFVAHGVDVAILARDRSALERLSDKLATGERKAVPVVVDLADSVALAAAVETARAELGQIDILVNNAGSSPLGSFDNLDDDDWQAAWSLKVMGYLRMIRAVLPEMRSRRQGRIVNVVGAGGRVAGPHYALGALNAALLHATKSIGDLVAPDGIIVLAVNPGLTLTERGTRILEEAAASAGIEPSEQLARTVSAIPIRRALRPEEIARIVAVLCTEVGELMAGSAFQADGGSAAGAF